MLVRDTLDDLRHRRTLIATTPTSAATVSAGAIRFMAIARSSALSDW